MHGDVVLVVRGGIGEISSQTDGRRRLDGGSGRDIDTHTLRDSTHHGPSTNVENRAQNARELNTGGLGDGRAHPHQKAGCVVLCVCVEAQRMTPCVCVLMMGGGVSRCASCIDA